MLVGKGACIGCCAVFFCIWMLGWAIGASAQPVDLSKLDIVERSLPDGPVALVDGQGVSRADFLFLYHTELLAMADRGSVAKLPEKARVGAGLVTLRKLLEREILFREAERKQLTVTDAEAQEAFQVRLESLKKEMTAADGTAPTEAQVLEQARQTREEALASIRKTLMVEKVRDTLVAGKDGKVPDADVRKFYENRPELFRRPGTIHLQQIFMKPGPSPKNAPESAWEKTNKLMDKAVARIHAGESFEAVARELSEAPNREKGGDMGPMPEESLPPFFLEAVQKMQPGAISPIIRSELGLHVIKLIGRDAGGEVTFEQAKDRIAQLLKGVKDDEIVSNFCQGVLDAGRVKIFLQLERHLAAMQEKQDAQESAPEASSKPDKSKAQADAPAQAEAPKKSGKPDKKK